MESTKTDRGIVYKDPAMVMVGFSRQTHGFEGVSLFGSSIKNSTSIALKICRADVTRNLSQDWYHATTAPLIEVTLSPYQFADLLTSMNVGYGVPGTLDYFEGEHYSPPKMPDKATQFKEEISGDFTKIVQNLMQASKVIEDMIDDPKPLGKKAREDLKRLIETFKKTIEDHLPFIINQFNRQLSQTVCEAKAEVDAFVTQTVMKTGIEALKSNAPSIKLLEDANG